MSTGSWVAPLDRRSWHEAGHLLVAMSRSGVAHGVELLDNGDARTIPDQVGNYPSPATEDDWLDVVAWSVAGKVAVKWAIECDLLAPAPAGVEREHGEHGYCGGDGTDEAHAKSNAAKVPSMSEADALAEGQRRALETMTAQNENFRNLFWALFYSGSLSSGQVSRIVT